MVLTGESIDPFKFGLGRGVDEPPCSLELLKFLGLDGLGGGFSFTSVSAKVLFKFWCSCDMFIMELCGLDLGIFVLFSYS